VLRTAIVANPYQNPRSIAYRFRQRRYRHIAHSSTVSSPVTGAGRIIDIGGTEIYWNIACRQIDDPQIEIDLIDLQFTEKPGS
jgi:hypothetical protein